MIPTDCQGLDALPFRKVLDRIGGLFLVAVAFHEVDVVSVLLPPISHVAGAENVSDALTFKVVVGFIQHFEAFGDGTEVHVGDESELALEWHFLRDVRLIGVPRRPIGEPIGLVVLAERQITPHRTQVGNRRIECFCVHLRELRKLLKLVSCVLLGKYGKQLVFIEHDALLSNCSLCQL